MVIRTCIGCRERAEKSTLVRVVAAGDPPSTVVLDPDGRRPGRGAHLHPDPGCLDLAVRRKAFGRALRLTGTLDLTQVVEQLAPDAGHAPPARPT
jgi:predicted RNA-binding protein YlxR (DUF448 family)